MSGSKQVKDLKTGSSVDATFLVMEKELREFVAKPGHYLQVKLGDSTGSIWARCWDRAEAVAATFELGDIVRVRGVVDSFKGRLQLIFEPNGIERRAISYDVTDYLPRTTRDIDQMFVELLAKAERIENEYLKRIVLSFLIDPAGAQAFKKAPAAKIHHHNYIGGLLEHTLAVVTLCETITGLHPELDRDLLLAGAILHDLGKTAAYEYTVRIDVTDEGGLVNHIVLGYQMVDESIRRYKDFPDELRLRLLHLILSHHNYGEWGSPVRPLFAEAEALCHADMLDSQLQEFVQLQRYEEGKGKDGIWSDFIRSLDRFLYLSPEKKRTAAQERERT
ncbi:MAG TPA: HD domain-containing protein [Methanomicrobia archaeon]|nr:HD domain-containing protein [Methanomicrobia archaeon]